MELSVLKCVSIGVMIVACGLPTFVFVTVAVSTCTSLGPRYFVTFVIVVIVKVRQTGVKFMQKNNRQKDRQLHETHKFQADRRMVERET